jgi:hypothetical protein
MKLELTSPKQLTLPDWLKEPIYIGGDRFSDTPGMMIQLTLHRVGNGFDIELKPIHPDRPELTEQILKSLGNRLAFRTTSPDKFSIIGRLNTSANYKTANGSGYLLNHFIYSPLPQDTPNFEIIVRNRIKP